MYKQQFNKRRSLRFKHFTRHGYALFSVLGKEVLVGVLSVSTLTYAKADGISTDIEKADTTLLNNGREVELDEVDVSASRAPLAVSRQPRMVTVLSREDIQAAPVQSVNDLLKYAVGADVRQKGPMGVLTDVSLRGGSSEQITILLNGINICDPQTGHNAFDFPCDLSDIERIEVLEGPAARVYGSSSLLGAINIVTRQASVSSLSAHAEGGSYGYLSAGAGANIASGAWNNQLSGSYSRSDGYLRNKAGRLNSDYKSGKAFYQGSYTDEWVNVRWHAGMSLKDFGSNTFYGVRWDDQFEHTLKTYTALQAETKKGRVHFRPAVYWNRNMDRFELYRDDDGKEHGVPFNYHRTDIYGLNLNSYFDWILGRTAIGAEMRNEDLVSTRLGEPLSHPRHVHGTDRDYTRGVNRTNIQFVLEHNILLERFTLSAGITAVKNSFADMNMRVYPGVDASYRIGQGWKVYASYNSSLRMPSFTELYYTQGGYQADSHLKPEELSAVEGGVKYQSHGVAATAAVFYNHYRNLIDWIDDGTVDADGNTFWQSVNYGHINALGVETAVNIDFHSLIPTQHVLRNLRLGYCWLNQRHDEQDGVISQYALEYLKNKFTASVQLNPWRSLNFEADWRMQHRMGNYKDIDGATHAYSTYGVLDCRLSWDKPRYSVYVEGNNLLGRHYIDYGNIPQPGRWIVAGVKVNMEL